VISGKLTGPRSRTEKFISGYIKHSGKPAIDLVDKGYSVAVKKLGVIGCQVRIIPPDVRLPDDFRIEKPQAAPRSWKSSPPKPGGSPRARGCVNPEKKSDLDQLLESEPAAAPTPWMSLPQRRAWQRMRLSPMRRRIASHAPRKSERLWRSSRLMRSET